GQTIFTTPVWSTGGGLGRLCRCEGWSPRRKLPSAACRCEGSKFLSEMESRRPTSGCEGAARPSNDFRPQQATGPRHIGRGQTEFARRDGQRCESILPRLAQKEQGYSGPGTLERTASKIITHPPDARLS